MMKKLSAYSLLLAALLSYLLSASAFFTMLYALSLRETMVAIETAFGSFVAALLLLGFGRLAWLSGMARLRPKQKA